MSNSIRHTVFFPHSPETVWPYLTNASLMKEWLMENDFLPVVGHDFQFRIKPMPDFDFDGIVYCRVLEIIPLKKLSYSWKGGPGNGSITMDSVVEWTLRAKDGGTELLLNHSGFGNFGKLLIYPLMDAGWLRNMHKINELINKATHGSTSA